MVRSINCRLNMTIPLFKFVICGNVPAFDKLIILGYLPPVQNRPGSIRRCRHYRVSIDSDAPDMEQLVGNRTENILPSGSDVTGYGL
jgi:hypothetical protein